MRIYMKYIGLSMYVCMWMFPAFGVWSENAVPAFNDRLSFYTYTHNLSLTKMLASSAGYLNNLISK